MLDAVLVTATLGGPIMDIELALGEGVNTGVGL